jgi:hypothetical protein
MYKTQYSCKAWTLIAIQVVLIVFIWKKKACFLKPRPIR